MLILQGGPAPNSTIEGLDRSQTGWYDTGIVRGEVQLFIKFGYSCVMILHLMQANGFIDYGMKSTKIMGQLAYFRDYNPTIKTYVVF